MAASKKGQSATPSKPAESNGNGEVNRHTRSFTPVRDYDTVALVGIQMHSSIKVDDKLAADLQNAIRDAALGIVKRMVPTAVKLTTKDSSAWARITGDTEASVKVAKTRTASTSKSVDRIFGADDELEAKFKASARKALAAQTGQPDHAAALKVAIAELKLTREQVAKLTSAQMATQLMGPAEQPKPAAKK